MKLKCLLRADLPTENGNIYPKDVLKSAIEEYKKNNLMFIVRDAANSNLCLSETVGIISDVDIEEDGYVYVEAKILDKNLIELFQARAPKSLNSMSKAEKEDIVENGDGTRTIKNKCEIIYFALNGLEE